MIYFTGCIHFGHYNIIKLANRPFTSVQEMDSVLIENWNKTVKPSDTVIHHGNFSYKGEKNPQDYLRKLNGNIICIRGNHDSYSWVNLTTSSKKTTRSSYVSTIRLKNGMVGSVV